MLYRTLTIMTTGLILMGCAGATSTSSSPLRNEAPEPPTMSQSDDACGAQQVQRYVGLAYTEAIGERLEEESGAGAVRVKRPGMAYTLEYRADRLDVGIDEDEVIQTIRCG